MQRVYSRLAASTKIEHIGTDRGNPVFCVNIPDRAEPPKTVTCYYVAMPNKPPHPVPRQSICQLLVQQAIQQCRAGLSP